MGRILAERPADLPLTLLMRMIREAEARLDQDGLAPREEIMRAARSLRIWEDSNGMLRLTGVFDPETGAPVKAAVESLFTGMIGTAGCSRMPSVPSATMVVRTDLAERDGGCARCGLDVAYTHAHHITWWECDNGPTDISNGTNCRYDLRERLADHLSTRPVTVRRKISVDIIKEACHERCSDPQRSG